MNLKPLLSAIYNSILILLFVFSIYFIAKGGPYAAFGGRDASRGLATFNVTSSDTEEYDDLSDLDTMEMESVREWEMQFKGKYFSSIYFDSIKMLTMISISMQIQKNMSTLDVYCDQEKNQTAIQMKRKNRVNQPKPPPPPPNPTPPNPAHAHSSRECLVDGRGRVGAAGCRPSNYVSDAVNSGAGGAVAAGWHRRQSGP